MIGVIVTVATLYILLVLAVTFWQRRLLYFPVKLTSGIAAEIAFKESLLRWKNESAEVIGWRLPSNGCPSGAVLIVHGNSGCALDRSYFSHPIHNAASLEVFILEYPGYGARGGSPNQKSFLDAAEEAFDLLPKDIPKYVVGESLGSGVVAHLAKTHGKQISGVVLFAPYDDIVSVAQEKFRFLPIRLMMADRFTTAKWLKEYRGPVKIILAEADEIIPQKFGRRLYDEYLGPKEIQVVSGAHHNEICEQSSEWWQNILAFWNGHSQTPRKR
jgi:uncharacterized protein